MFYPFKKDGILFLSRNRHAGLGHDPRNVGLDVEVYEIERTGLKGSFNVNKELSSECVPFIVGLELNGRRLANTFVGWFLQLGGAGDGDKIGD